MEHDANAGRMGPSDSRSPSEVRSVAQSEVKHTSEVLSRKVRAFRGKVRFLEVALIALNPEESGVRVELQAVLRRAKEVMQKPLQRSSMTPDTRAAEARLKVVKLGESSGGIGGHRWS